MSREEYAELLYGSDSAEMSLEVQSARTELLEPKSRCKLSHTAIIHKILWSSIAAAQRSTEERIRRAGGVFLMFCTSFSLIGSSLHFIVFT